MNGISDQTSPNILVRRVLRIGKGKKEAIKMSIKKKKDVSSDPRQIHNHKILAAETTKPDTPKPYKPSNPTRRNDDRTKHQSCP